MGRQSQQLAELFTSASWTKLCDFPTGSAKSRRLHWIASRAEPWPTDADRDRGWADGAMPHSGWWRLLLPRSIPIQALIHAATPPGAPIAMFD
jgi:hypothetical protein